MDLFEQFGITPETQQIITVFSLVFTLVYPLVRWGVIPAVRWVFKRRPRSELFQAILKRMESDSATVRGNWLVSDKLMVDGMNDHTPVVKWVSDDAEYTNLDGFLTKREKRKIFRIASKKVREFKDKEEQKMEERLLAEIQPQGSNGPFQFCANGMPYVPDKPAVQVVFTPECSPAMESNLTRQESVEAPEPPQGDESVRLEALEDQVISRNKTISELEQRIQNQAATIREWTDRDEKKSQQIQEFRKLSENQQGIIKEQRKEMDKLMRGICEADKTIKNQQDLIDRLNRERVADVVGQPSLKDCLNRVTEKTQIEDVKELARIICTSEGKVPDEKEVNRQEKILQETVGGLKREYGSHFRVVWEKAYHGYWVPVLKSGTPLIKEGEKLSDMMKDALSMAKTPVLNIPKQT